MVDIVIDRGVARVTLDRPAQHNALTGEMMVTLTDGFRRLGREPEVRVIVLTGRGRSFCAGADLTMMRAEADNTFEENVANAEVIFDLMAVVRDCPRPVIARVNGATIGGGVGLVSCADIAVAVERAVFALSEVRLGLVPAVISPFVLARIGAGTARELFLTGERFPAGRAHEIGLVHHVVPDEATLDEKVAERIEALQKGSPQAQAAAKELVNRVANLELASLRAYTTRLIARCRDSEDGREGMSSFLEKRLPRWQRPPGDEG